MKHITSSVPTTHIVYKREHFVSLVAGRPLPVHRHTYIRAQVTEHVGDETTFYFSIIFAVLRISLGKSRLIVDVGT